MLGRVALSDDVRRIAEAAGPFAASGERVEAVLAAEVRPGERTYVCSFAAREGLRTWLALDDAGQPVTARLRVRDAVSIAAMCEVAEEAAGRLDGATGAAPRLASPEYLDSLGGDGADPVAAAMQSAIGAVDELAKDVEGHYKVELK
jgi:hypothetical protein